MNSTVKTVLIWVLMIACLISVWQFVSRTAGGAKDSAISLSQMQDYADKGKKKLYNELCNLLLYYLIIK